MAKKDTATITTTTDELPPLDQVSGQTPVQTAASRSESSMTGAPVAENIPDCTCSRCIQGLTHELVRGKP